MIDHVKYIHTFIFKSIRFLIFSIKRFLNRILAVTFPRVHINACKIMPSQLLVCLGRWPGRLPELNSGRRVLNFVNPTQNLKGRMPDSTNVYICYQPGTFFTER